MEYLDIKLPDKILSIPYVIGAGYFYPEGGRKFILKKMHLTSRFYFECGHDMCYEVFLEMIEETTNKPVLRRCGTGLNFE